MTMLLSKVVFLLGLNTKLVINCLLFIHKKIKNNSSHRIHDNEQDCVLNYKMTKKIFCFTFEMRFTFKK